MTLAIRAGIAISVILLFGVAPYVSAHHSIAGVYDSNQRVTIEGVVKQFHFVNPHPFVILNVRDASGGLQPWQIELDNRWELVEIGMTANTLKPGDQVIVTGNRGRVQSHSLYVRRLDRPADGFWYEQVGSSPRIR